MKEKYMISISICIIMFVPLLAGEYMKACDFNGDSKISIKEDVLNGLVSSQEARRETTCKKEETSKQKIEQQTAQ